MTNTRFVRRGFCLTLACSLLVCTPADGSEAFVRVSPRDARYFELSDGQPYIPIGMNLAAVGRSPEPGRGLQLMDRWLGRLAANGGNFARVWLSAPYWDVESQQAGRYEEEQARRIDALLELARRHGIRLKLTVEHFREIEPDPAAQRQAWAAKPVHHVSRGGTAESMAHWLSNPASRRQFVDKLAWYGDRYGDDPIVFGWELWNEINAVRGGDYMDWTAAMLPELKRRFPKNLAMQSLGSFDREEARAVNGRLARMAGNEVAQVHRYLDLGARLEVCHGPVDVLSADAVAEMLAFEPGKPVLLAEGGAVEPNHTGPFQLYARDREGIILHDVIFAPFFAGAAGTGHCWHWDHYVDANDLWWQFARFARAVEGLDPPAEQFQPRVLEHDRLRIYVLQGKKTLLAWCRDRQNTWQTELAEAVAPETIREATVELADLTDLDQTRQRIYDPWTDRWTEGQVVGTTLLLPPFTRSIVIRIE